VGFGGGAAGVGRHGVGERANRWGPCVGERRERRHRGWKARIIEENIFCGIRQRRTRADEGNDGLRMRRAGSVKEEEGADGAGGPKRLNGPAGCWAGWAGS
jgi:hypothetical protein